MKTFLAVLALSVAAASAYDPDAVESPVYTVDEGIFCLVFYEKKCFILGHHVCKN